MCSCNDAEKDRTNSDKSAHQAPHTSSDNTESESLYLLSILLNRSSRNEKGVSDTLAILNNMGISVSGKGVASITARINQDSLMSVFSMKESDVNVSNPKSSSLSNTVVPIPNELQPFVESISFEPIADYHDIK